ncbi:MAG TPA: DNA translocase FtsK [Patescibacteria group bacterium]|nr:DNA translocase FtsK [Patescibacteria group bacterium]
MAKKKKSKNNKKPPFKKKRPNIFFLPEEIRKKVLGLIVFILAIIVVLSFFGRAGIAGSALLKVIDFLIGKALFIIPLVLVLAGLVLLNAKYRKIFSSTVLAIFISVAGLAGFLESLKPLGSEIKEGGWLGYILALPFRQFFGVLVSRIVFGGVILIGGFIFWHLIKGPKTKEITGTKETPEAAAKEPSLMKKIFLPKFKIKEIEPKIKEALVKLEEPVLELKSKEVPAAFLNGEKYKLPPLELLETDKGKAAAGDIVTNSAIIKKTLENFGLPVEMSEINIGPTVTQYTLKPAEGIKLSKITALSNNFSLALASHPIRIEAPIPGKSLVGIEVPNKVRCQIRLRDLIANPQFQKSVSNLNVVLGKDVSGFPCYADLARMPHLLVAGATGTGKTIFLNSLILSLLYQNSPGNLRFILIDPKRVEFSAYKDLPHLLTPVIFDPQRTINALKWLITEMEKRFDILSVNGSRNIASYNEKTAKEGGKTLPYIVLIIDELADLMMAKGREMEAGIVRLAQMARAVGIHLVVATQRPSVEVITGLIKANITSRVTFQVASQIDSRTVLDTSGAEKLLGAGDLLFISADISKPKRIQGSYISEKEVRRVVDYTKIQKEKWLAGQEVELFENHLAEDLEKSLEGREGKSGFEDDNGGDDPLYNEAKKIVIEAQKGSASFLQRRLRIGYARAARLLDILEEHGIVGPGEGAKPREILFKGNNSQPEGEEIGEGEDWEKV